MELIDKSAVVAEIERLKSFYDDDENIRHVAKYNVLALLVNFLDTLEVKEVDLDKEIELVKGDYEQVDVAWNNDFDFIAKHFFELGLRVNNPITAADRGMAEEIINNLKRVEQDYHIDLTKEMEWLRNSMKKRE